MAFFEARAQHMEGVTQNRFRDFWVWDSIAGVECWCVHTVESMARSGESPR